MSVKSFKFVSPGVFINEIDNSFIPKSADLIGPCIIGRSTRGLAMQPVKVESYSDFVTMFGDTVAGGAGGDVYRYGNYQSPMYGTYAAKAFLRANVAPVTYIRLLGQQTSAGSTAGGDAAAGWKTTNAPGLSATAQGGAYVKIGKLVHCEGYITCSSIDTTDGSGVQLNLPFNADGDQAVLMTLDGANCGLLTSAGLTAMTGARIGTGSSTIVMTQDNVTDFGYNVGLNSSGTFTFAFSYIA